MRPQKALSAGNCEFRNLGITHYFNKLGILGITHTMSFSTYHETIKFGGKEVTVAIAVGILVFALGATLSYGDALTVGRPTPVFTLTNADGKQVNMTTLLDRPAVIYFTHNACHYCTQIIAHLKRADAKFGREDLSIFGINVMARDEKLIKAYKEELGFIFPMLAGNRGDVLRAFKIAYVPVLVFVDRNGITRKVVGHYIHEPELHRNIIEIMAQ